MGQQGWRTTANNPYVYQEIDSGVSVAYGLDTSTNLLNIKAQATVGAVPTGTGQIQINPAAVGNITLTPNGAAGRVVIAKNLTVSTGNIIFTPLTTARASTVRASPTGTLAALVDPAVDGQVMISSSVGVATWASITAGAGITLTPGHNSLQISSVGGGFTWNEVLLNTVALAADNGYILENVGLTTASLPALCPVGDTIRIVGTTAGLFRITQGLGQSIKIGSTSTTPGVAGALDSTAIYDVLELLCVVANTTFVVLSSVGNFTVS
jgi:hypothetical protein